MSIRAVIFDIYNTLLTVSPPPADAAQQWENLLRETFGAPATCSLEEFAAIATINSAREHAAARAAGVDFPEIDWPAVARKTLPELNRLAPAAIDEFLYRHVQLQHTARLSAGAAPVLQRLSRSGMLLGIASNAQAYTWRELDVALASAGLARTIFQPDLCFLSFEKKFSKPSPRVFQQLTEALLKHGVSAAETIMVGDRLDKDIEPARAQGWQTLHFSVISSTKDWDTLARLL